MLVLLFTDNTVRYRLLNSMNEGVVIHVLPLTPLTAFTVVDYTFFIKTHLTFHLLPIFSSISQWSTCRTPLWAEQTVSKLLYTSRN